MSRLPLFEEQPDRLSLGAVRGFLGDCRRCKLCRTRRHIVFGEGDEHARMMLVGEGPGETEDLTARPFVGKAGILLDAVLLELGIPRASLYITNLVKCRPPRNRNPEPDEVASCDQFLVQQILSVRPQVIVTLGAPASQHLLRTDKHIGALRGRLGRWQDHHVLPTYHPAYVLRNPEARAALVEDLKLARRIAAGG